MIRDFPCDCEHGPRHWMNIVVFILSIMAIVFMMAMDQPVRVGVEDPNSIESQIVERKE